MKEKDEIKVASLDVPSEARKYGSLEDTPITFVDTEELLEEMRGKLAAASEVAIDLEHHN